MFIDLLDGVIIVFLCIFFYRLIRKTEALKIISGIFIIYFLSFLADYSGLVNTANILKNATNLGMFGLVMIFHPELRMALKKIGGLTDITMLEKMELVANIEEAVFELAKSKTGALIIFDPEEKLLLQTEDMVEIGASCTKELLETIFFPNTALHDGAVIIHQDKIAYAGCKLPLSGKKRQDLGHLGTRHLAAVEIAERFDLVAIVVSEETGNISIANNKGIYRVKSPEMFRSFFKEKEERNKLIEKITKKFSK